ncbi:serotriflin-like [Sphaerodactylus townsendi]|uniref:serotriflin-like n=1 Tax=Sphaerodactylus townsendi TaxID=933632 RepID=UPI0020264F50|nr:serotriflin-like [Sphaerodactylus townsendi]
MKKLITDKHNEIRRKVKPTAANMLKMVWNENVAEQARKVSEQCLFQSSPMASRTLGHMVCGENILQTNNFKEWAEVIKFWTAGKDYFKYGTGATDPAQNVFGYTQMIWYNSYQIGCSVSYCETATFPFLYICHYCPGGNFVHQIPTPYKSGPTCEHCPGRCEDKLCTCGQISASVLHSVELQFPVADTETSVVDAVKIKFPKTSKTL